MNLGTESHWANFGNECSYPTGGGGVRTPALVSLWKKAVPWGVNSPLATSHPHKLVLWASTARENPWVKVAVMQLLDFGSWTVCTEAGRGRYGWDSNSPYFIAFLGKLNEATHIKNLKHTEYSMCLSLNLRLFIKLRLLIFSI